MQLDLADFTAAMNQAKATRGDKTDSLLSQLAEQAMRTAVEPEPSRARARFELLMVAARDPELSAVFQSLMDQFTAISEEAVAQLQQRTVPLTPPEFGEAPDNPAQGGFPLVESR